MFDYIAVTEFYAPLSRRSDAQPFQQADRQVSVTGTGIHHQVYVIRPAGIIRIMYLYRYIKSTHDSIFLRKGLRARNAAYAATCIFRATSSPSTTGSPFTSIVTVPLNGADSFTTIDAPGFTLISSK